jgi:VanZ family protein
MAAAQRHLEPKCAAITAVAIAVIVYGSLYPFTFYDNPNPAGPFHNLWATRNILSGRGDLLANFLLYIPLGFFGVRTHRHPRFSSLILAMVIGISLSTAVELIQFYDAGRNSAMSDVYVNAAGTLFGATAAMLSRHMRSPGVGWIRRHDFVALLLVCWLGYRLFPYAPVIDLHKYWDAVKPLFLHPTVSGLDAFRHAVTWFAISILLETIIGASRTRLAVMPLLIAILFARIMIAHIVLSWAEIIGGLIGVLLWISALSRRRHRVMIVAGLFILVVVLEGLAPFNFSNEPRRFGWVPFRSFVRGSEESAVASFFEKTFMYGCLVWLMVHAGCSWRFATASGAILVFGLRWMQVYLPGRSAEITDVVLLLIVAATMWLMSEDLPLNSPRRN